MNNSKGVFDVASGSSTDPAQSSLVDAVADAVRAGAVELARLEGIVAEAETRLRDAWQYLSSNRAEALWGLLCG